MTPEEWEKRLPIVVAYVLGETVEYFKPEDDKWYDAPSFGFSLSAWQYRIVKDDGTYVYFDLMKKT